MVRTGRPQDVLDTALNKMSVTLSNTTGEFFVFISDPGTLREKQQIHYEPNQFLNGFNSDYNLNSIFIFI